MASSASIVFPVPQAACTRNTPPGVSKNQDLPKAVHRKYRIPNEVEHGIDIYALCDGVWTRLHINRGW